MRNPIRLALFAGCCLILIGLRAARAEEHMVFAKPDNTFDPAELTIMEGDTVTWTNDGGFHNVRADDDDFRCANGCDEDKGDGDPASNAWSFSLDFASAGTIPYYCEIHGGVGGSGMSGIVEVVVGAIFADGFESGDTMLWTTVVP